MAHEDMKERIVELELQLKNTKVNKKTEMAVGQLKSKIAKIKEELEVKLSKGIADLVTLTPDSTRSVEIETKISISDLKNEFSKRTKKAKHSFYESSRAADNKPNYFYFAMPEALLDKARLVIDEHANPDYGILAVDDLHKVRVAKRAKALNKSKNTRLKHTLFMRACSELTTLRSKECNFVSAKYPK